MKDGVKQVEKNVKRKINPSITPMPIDAPRLFYILPYEMLINIFFFLDLQALINIEFVSKFFQKLASTNLLWQNLIRTHFPHVESIETLSNEFANGPKTLFKRQSLLRALMNNSSLMRPILILPPFPMERDFVYHYQEQSDKSLDKASFIRTLKLLHSDIASSDSVNTQRPSLTFQYDLKKSSQEESITDSELYGNDSDLYDDNDSDNEDSFSPKRYKIDKK